MSDAMDNAVINKLFREYIHIAVVGLSADPSRPSYRVSKYMQQQGFQLIPVNPKYDKLFGEICYPNLTSIPGPVDMVNLFQRAENIPPFIDEAITIGAKSIWMQLGIVDTPSAKKAADAGLDVVMDRCLKIEYARYLEACSDFCDK